MLLTGSFLFLSRPFEIIHFAKLLEQFHFSSNEQITENRLSRAYRYIKYPDNPEMRRLGPVKQKWANSLLERARTDLGVEFKTDVDLGTGKSGVLERIDFVDPVKASQNIDFDDLDRRGFNVQYDSRGRPVSLDLRNPAFWDFKTGGAIKSITHSLGYKKIGVSLTSRVLKTRYGADFKPYGKIQRRESESLRAWLDRVRRQTRNSIRSGEFPSKARQGGTDSDELTEQEKRERERISESVDEFDKIADPDVDKTKSNIKAASAAFGVGALCVLHAATDRAEELEYANKQLPMMRIASRIISGGNQLMAGNDVELAEIGDDIERFYDEGNEAEGVRPSSWTDATSIQYELGEEPKGTDIPDSARFGGEKKLADKLTAGSGIPGLSTFCGVLSSQLAQIAFFIVSPLEEAFEALVLDRIFAFGIDALANIIAGEPVRILASGAELGNLANHGARLSANDQAFTLGGQQLSKEEETEITNLTNKYIHQDYANTGLVYRLFSLDNPDSPAFRFFSSISRPREVAGGLANFNFGPIARKILSPFGVNLVGAAEKYSYDYGFPMVGFSASQLDDPKVSNPFANAEMVEPYVAPWKDESGNEQPGLNKTYGKCFGLTVNLDGSFNFNKSVRFDSKSQHYENHSPDSACTSRRIARPTTPIGPDELTRFRFFILDLMSQTAIACYEGDAKACLNLGLTEEEAADTGVGVVTGDTQQLASDILKSPSVAFWTNNGVNTLDVVVALSEGKPAYTTCSNAPNKTTGVNPNILKFIYEAAQQTNVMVNALTDKCHTDGSKHYSGEAVDLDINNSGPLSVLSPIAKKYGGSKNSETTHHHFDFSKN